MKANHICGPESSCDMECAQAADEANAEAIELRDGFKRVLEQEIVSLIGSIDQLIEMHASHKQESMQKSYLWKARRELINAKDWFDWERRQKAQRVTPASGGADDGR